jgi:hypothetical protein
LDKYIDLILKNVTNVDEFIYLVKNSDYKKLQKLLEEEKKKKAN